MPPFYKLTNDEDRERKAEYQQIGTYNVIANPDSFTHLDEYRAFRESSKDPMFDPPTCIPAEHARLDQKPGERPPNEGNNTYASGDPDIVILRLFEDESAALGSPRSTFTPSRSSMAATDSTRSPMPPTPNQDYFKFSHDNTPLMKMANKDGRDHELIYYYKNFVHRHLAQVHRDSLGTSLETGVLTAPDVFERQAANFLPVWPLSLAFAGTEQKPLCRALLTYIALPRPHGILRFEHVLQERNWEYRRITALSESTAITAGKSTERGGSDV